MSAVKLPCDPEPDPDPLACLEALGPTSLFPDSIEALDFIDSDSVTTQGSKENLDIEEYSSVNTESLDSNNQNFINNNTVYADISEPPYQSIDRAWLKSERKAMAMAMANTNQSNQTQSLAIIEDDPMNPDYAAVKHVVTFSEPHTPPLPIRDIPIRDTPPELPPLEVRRRPPSDSHSLSSPRSSKSNSGSDFDINTSRTKVICNDRVKFGSLDPRKLEDVTPSKFRNGRYENPWETWRMPTIGNVLKWLFSKNNSNVPSKSTLEKTLPVLKPDHDEIKVPPIAGVRVTWIGHATTLVQFDGISVLTDPIFSDRCGPMSWMGPKRYRPPPCLVKNLPKIDAVVISHSHFDHLDAPSVSALNARFGSDLRWFVPLGVLDWMTSMGCENVIEMDWWQENCIPTHSDVTFAFTPSQHWGQRTPTDRFKTLWGSWCIMGPNHSFFFAGDTGYCRGFEEIGRRYGPFDLAAIPIGAYEPRFVMRGQHVDPTEAVQIHQDVNARKSIGIHWGTFVLTYEHYLDPPKEVKKALESKGLPQEDFFVMKHGESRLILEDSSIEMD